MHHEFTSFFQLNAFGCPSLPWSCGTTTRSLWVEGRCACQPAHIQTFCAWENDQKSCEAVLQYWIVVLFPWISQSTGRNPWQRTLSLGISQAASSSSPWTLVAKLTGQQPKGLWLDRLVSSYFVQWLIPDRWIPDKTMIQWIVGYQRDMSQER